MCLIESAHAFSSKQRVMVHSFPCLAMGIRVDDTLGLCENGTEQGQTYTNRTLT
jgi:hypothetical protein